MLNTSAVPAPDAIAVLDLDPVSGRYGTIVGRVDMPNVGDELHHFGWNACSSCLRHPAESPPRLIKTI